MGCKVSIQVHPLPVLPDDPPDDTSPILPDDFDSPILPEVKIPDDFDDDKSYMSIDIYGPDSEIEYV
jgi:hypothetical protein